MDNPFILSQLISARLCHDLATPLSAIAMGLELLDDHYIKGEAIPLIKDSSAQARAKLTMLRGLFSTPSPQTLKDAAKIFQESMPASQWSLHWPQQYAEASYPWPTLMLHLCYFGAESLPKGGTLGITVPANNIIQLDAHGAFFSTHPDLIYVLTQPVELDEITPRTVQAYYLKKQAALNHLRVNLNIQDRKMTLILQN